MRNFTGSVDCWRFLGGEGEWRQGQTILLRKNNDEGGAGCLAWENAVLIKTIHLIATLKKWGVTVSLKLSLTVLPIGLWKFHDFSRTSIMTLRIIP